MRCLKAVKDARFARAAARSPAAILDGFEAARSSGFGRGGETAPSTELGNKPSDDVVARMLAYLLVQMLVLLLAQMVVLIGLAGGIFEGLLFQQTKALMKSVLCSTDFCDERRRPARERPAWSKHWLFWGKRTLAKTLAKT